MSRTITIQNLGRTPYVIQYTNSIGQRIETPIITESFSTFNVRLVSNNQIHNNVLILGTDQDRVIDFGVTTQGIFFNPRFGAEGLVRKLGDFILIIEQGFGSGNSCAEPNGTKNFNIQLNINLTVKKDKKKIKKLIKLLEELSELSD